MEVFKVRDGHFVEVRRAMLMRGIPIALLAVCGGLAIVILNDNARAERMGSILPVVIPIILGAIGLGLYIGIKRQKEVLESYRLILEEDVIVRQMAHTPELRIMHTDVRTIVRAANGALVIRGTSALNPIVNPIAAESCSPSVRFAPCSATAA